MQRHPVLFSFLLVAGTCVFLLFSFAFMASLFRSDSASLLSDEDSIAVLKIQGPIFESVKFIQKLNKLKEDDKIKALVLRMDSPGGAVAPSQEIFEEVKKFKQSKKVVVSMGTVAASGAYYISIGADKIFASRGTVTGSIGVIMESIGLQEIVSWAKVEPRIIKSGKFKDSGSPFREMTDDDRAYFQTLIDNMYAQFTTAVSEQRGLDIEKVKEYADGRVFTGEQAKAAGLIDEIGTINDAIAEAKKIANLPENAPVRWPSDNRSPLSMLFDDSRGEESISIKDFIAKYTGEMSWPLLFYFVNLPQTN